MRPDRTPITRKSLALTAMIALVIVSCGADDGGGVRDLGGDGSVSASASGSGSASASATADADCSPVNPDLEAEADTQFAIDALDYAFDPAVSEVESGIVTFSVENIGEEPHELAFLPGGGDVPFTEEGSPDEDALAEAGAFELEAFGPGQTCNATYDLEPGEYTIFCIVETADGTTHYELGMRGTLTVSS